MRKKAERKLITDLWQEHLTAPFPKMLRGKDMNGVDFVLLDAEIAGCVSTYVDDGKLNLYQTAVLGLAYHSASVVVPVLNDEGAAYYWRLGRLAELVLKAVALDNKADHYREE